MVPGIVRLESLLAVALLLLVPASAQVAGVSLSNHTITEGDNVEVCLELFEVSSIAGTARVTLITDDSQTGTTLTAGTDYIPLREEFVLTAASPSRQCVVLETLRDHAVEDIEIVEISLVNNSGVSVLPSVHLNIFPARDQLVVEFVKTSYTAREGEGELDMYIELIEGAIERAFPSVVEVEFTTLDLSTEGREDYASPVSVTFSAQDTVGSVKKVQLTVNDDSRVEGPETVHVVIVTDSGVMNPVTTKNQGVAAVTLLDNDIAFVELVSAEVATVVEDDDQGMGSSVELCVELLLEPVLPVDRDVVVILDNEDVTTDSSDYMLEETLLTFPPGSNSSSRLCTTLTTLPDAIEEGNETVVVHVVPVAPDTTPGGEQRSLTVTIINNDVNCPALPIPSYPLLIDASSGLNEGAAIVYSCAPGYKLNGDRQRNCVNRIWTGREPTCTVLDCGEPPPLENGDFSLGGTTVNSTAVYFCKEAYSESQGPGVSNKIHCMTNGKWSELNLKCIADESNQKKSEGLGGGGIAAIVIVVLLIMATVVGVVSLLGIWYYCRSRTGVKRSGKYVVDNSDIEDPQPMRRCMPLSPKHFEDEKFFEEEEVFIAPSSPTDV